MSDFWIHCIGTPQQTERVEREFAILYNTVRAIWNIDIITLQSTLGRSSTDCYNNTKLSSVTALTNSKDKCKYFGYSSKIWWIFCFRQKYCYHEWDKKLWIRLHLAGICWWSCSVGNRGVYEFNEIDAPHLIPSDHGTVNMINNVDDDIIQFHIIWFPGIETSDNQDSDDYLLQESTLDLNDNDVCWREWS